MHRQSFSAAAKEIAGFVGRLEEEVTKASSIQF
jgi:hypothetical protein